MTRVLTILALIVSFALTQKQAHAQVSCLYFRIVCGNTIEIHWCYFGRDYYGSEVQRRTPHGEYLTLPNSFCTVWPQSYECVFTDAHVTDSVSYYRIRMIALDGMVSYSDSLRVALDLAQADYVIITPASYAGTVSPLTAFRSSHNGFSVKTVTTDSIYAQFGQGTSPDSAIRRFVAFALTRWEDPKPQYFLLAGSVNAVPSHKEPGLFLPPEIEEDSISVDQWFVEADTTLSSRVPLAAIGRFPAWDLAQLQTMVTKTIEYENLTSAGWMSRAIAVADYYPIEGNIFEAVAGLDQSILANLWHDTVTVHVRQDSPLHRTRTEFRDLWNQGAAIINLTGHANSYQFSHDAYFTTWDVDSLSNGDRLPMFMVEGSQRFERSDTLPMAVSVLQAPSRGAVASYAPSGLVYAYENDVLRRAIFQQMSENPRTPLGKNILAARILLGYSDNDRKFTLFGDPALLIKNPIVAGVPPTPETPVVFFLHQNYPNPFNPETNISFDLPKSARVTLTIFNLIGQEVATIVSGTLPAGTHSYVVRGETYGLTSGVYFYRLSAGDLVQTKKMILLR